MRLVQHILLVCLYNKNGVKIFFCLTFQLFTKKKQNSGNESTPTNSAFHPSQIIFLSFPHPQLWVPHQQSISPFLLPLHNHQPRRHHRPVSSIFLLFTQSSYFVVWKISFWLVYNPHLKFVYSPKLKRLYTRLYSIYYE